MSRQVLDLRAAAALLRRHRRLLAVAGAIGAVLGGGYGFLGPASLRSTTLVLVSTASSGQGGPRAIETQVAIATSFGVLRAAGQSVRPALTSRQVADRIDVTAPTDQLMRIEASAGRAEQAQTLSQAVADAYLAAVHDTSRSIGADLIADLRKREETLETQVKGLQKEIDAASARLRSGDAGSDTGRRDAQLLAQLRAGQADLSLQLDKVKDQLTSSRVQGSAVQVAVTVIQRATPAQGASAARRALLDALSALGLAVAGTAGFLLVQARRDPRLRSRDDIADGVGSRVVSGVRSRPPATVAGWSALLDGYAPDPVDAWALRQALREVVPGGARGAGRSVSVLAFAGDGQGLCAGVQLAVFAAAIGLHTRLVPASRDDGAAALWAACAERAAEPRPGLLVAPPALDAEQEDAEQEDAEQEDAEEEAGLVVMLAVVDADAPAVPVADPDVTLLAVAPGVATRADLARLAVAVDTAGRRVDGVLLADPDVSDPTTGRRTLDQRLRQVGLPLRFTGTSPAAATAGARGARGGAR